MSELAEIVVRTLWISGSATLLSSTWSILLSYYLSRAAKASRLIVSILEGLVGVPTVLVGLLLYMVLSRSGPLGFLGLLYTPCGIIIGQAILVTPLIASTSYRVLNKAWSEYGELALTLGASNRQAAALVLREALPGILASIIMGFSRATGELGVALMIGGNIRGYTRVLTTAIALEVSRGEFEDALALGGVLVLIVVAISLCTRILKRVYEAWPSS